MYVAAVVVVGLVVAADTESSENPVPFEEAGKWGFKNPTGKIVVEPSYDEVGSFSGGLAPVNLGARVEHIFNPPIKTGGRWGYINAHGKLVVPVAFDNACGFSDGLARVLDRQSTRYLDTSGRVVIDLGKVSHAGDFREGLAPVYDDRSLAGKDWETRFIDKRGVTAFTVDGYAHEFRDGMAVVTMAQKQLDRKISNERHLDGYIDRTGNLIVSPRFAEAHDFHEGLAAVRPKKTTVYRRGDSWGYIDKSGRYVIVPQFNEAHPFRNGVARVHLGGTLETPFDAIPYWTGGEWRLIDRSGTTLRQSTKLLDYEDAVQPNR